VSATSLDYGTCGHHERLTRKITIRNAGDKTLTITKLKKSCDCTSIVFNGRPIPRGTTVRHPLAPQAAAELSVTLSTGRIMGVLHKYVEIGSDDPARPTIKLPVLARVHAGVKAYPWTLPSFTAVAGGPPITQEFTLVWLEKPGAEPILKDLKAKHPRVAVQAKRMTEKELAAELAKRKAESTYFRYPRFHAGYRITVTVTPPAKEGHFTANVTALVNGKNWEYGVRGYVFSGIMVEPRYFQFGKIEDPDLAEQTIVLRAVDGRSFDVAGITAEPDILAFQVRSDGDGTTHRITARIAEADRSRRFYVKVAIQTTHPKKPFIEASCYGFWAQK
jgi:hypothetical protein